jgi:hypothetical protein
VKLSGRSLRAKVTTPSRAPRARSGTVIRPVSPFAAMVPSITGLPGGQCAGSAASPGPKPHSPPGPGSAARCTVDLPAAMQRTATEFGE